MQKIQQVTVFTQGDSTQPSTWSNVPYLFTRTLEERGISVNRVDLAPGLGGKLINRAWRALQRLLPWESTFDYTRSGLHYLVVKRRVREAVRRYTQADVNIFLTFSFSSAGMSNQPTVLFGDWTYDHCISHFRGRTPNRLERAAIDRENREIEAADCVFVLFPSVAERMRHQYRNPHIYYAGNVVNALLHQPEAELLQRKAASTALLFIGNRAYLEGARRLLKAFVLLQQERRGWTLDIVGLTERELGPCPAGVRCHGYLDKGVASDRERYYQLMAGARCIVNTTPKWAAFSAMIEAMHFYTPVVVTPYEEFVQTFGRDIPFGVYCADEPGVDPAESLAEHLRGLDDAGHIDRCRAAHEAVADYQWDKYIDRLLTRINSCTPGQRRSNADVTGERAETASG